MGSGIFSVNFYDDSRVFFVYLDSFSSVTYLNTVKEFQLTFIFFQFCKKTIRRDPTGLLLRDQKSAFEIMKF